MMMSEHSKKKLALHEVMAKMCGIRRDRCQLTKNIFERDDASAPAVDLYVAGYPCPSWSRAGKKQGARDERGMITLQGLRYICTKRPRCLILEQVSALLDKPHKHVWQFLKKILVWLDYEIVWGKLNTRHYGIPQNRCRLYVIAVAKESLRAPLSMPAPRENHPDLHTFINKSVTGSERLSLPTYEEKLGEAMWKKGFVLDVQASARFQHPLVNCSPCLLKTRCAQGGYYIPKLQRRLLSEEVARFQGLPQPVIAAMSAVENLSVRALDEAAGDAMSVNVLQLVLRRCCDSAGLTRLGPSKDFWLNCPADKCFELSDKLWEKYAKVQT